jgi:hypothetical protein
MQQNPRADHSSPFTRASSLLLVFAIPDWMLKSAVNYAEAQYLGQALYFAFFSTMTCFTVILLLMVVTGRTHLLAFCAIYYVLASLFLSLLTVRSLSDLGRLTMEVGPSMAVSMIILSFLLLVSDRYRARRSE